MKLGDILCCLLFTITLTATCARGESERQRRDIAMGRPKRILKRDAAILIDNFPIESSSFVNHKPKVIYRRISRQRYGPPKPKYGPPRRPKYGPPPKSRKPSKKYRKQVSSKYRTPSHKKRAPKPRYGPPKRPITKPVYGPPKKVPSHYYTPEPAGFAEPPADYEPQHPKEMNSYAEPPVDSYGAPLKASVIDNYPTAPTFGEPVSSFDNQDFNNFGQEFNSWQNFQNVDNSYAYSKKRPLFVKPDEAFNQPQIAPQNEEDFNLNSYTDVYSYNHNFKEPPYVSSRKKKPQFFSETNKRINKHWKASRPRPEGLTEAEEIVVGGQYAEPPPRYVPKFQPSAPMFTGEDDFNPPQTRFTDSEVAASATISPYVNYKHSNMAFSPQNLNDAFSIVDK